MSDDSQNSLFQCLSDVYDLFSYSSCYYIFVYFCLLCGAFVVRCLYITRYDYFLFLMIMANGGGNKEIRRNPNECFVCKKTCYNTCSRCGEYYCSKQCQSIDWQNHKYYCFEMPELIMRSNAQPSDNSPKFQSPNHRQGFEQVQSNSLEPPAADSQRTQNAHKRDEDSIRSPPQPLVFNFAGYPENNEDVVITHVRSACIFYIRPCASNSEYRKNAKDFDDYGTRSKELECLPQRNDVILVKYDGLFHRAVVINVDSKEKIEVGLADIGRNVTKSMNDMRQISDELRNRLQYNFMVILHEMPKKLEPVSFKKLFEFLNDQIVFKIQFDGNDWKSSVKYKLLERDSGLPIERFICGTESNRIEKASEPVDKSTLNDAPTHSSAAVKPASVASNIEKLVHSPNGAEDLSKSHQPLKELATETLPEVATLVILDNSSIRLKYVSAVEEENFPKLGDLYDRVMKYGNSSNEIFEPEVDDLCLVKFGSDWYRAINCGSKFWLIDWGNMEKIDPSNVRRLPDELKGPCYTFLCNIDVPVHKLANNPSKMEELNKLLRVKSVHPNCRCVKVEGELMDYDVSFPVLLNFFD